LYLLRGLRRGRKDVLLPAAAPLTIRAIRGEAGREDAPTFFLDRNITLRLIYMIHLSRSIAFLERYFHQDWAWEVLTSYPTQCVHKLSIPWDPIVLDGQQLRCKIAKKYAHIQSNAVVLKSNFLSLSQSCQPCQSLTLGRVCLHALMSPSSSP